MRSQCFRLVLLAMAAAYLLTAGCKTQRSEPILRPVFHQSKLEQIDGTVALAVAQEKCPGAVIWLEHSGTSYHKAYGHRALSPVTETMSNDTIFDAASLTKVIATTPAVLLLVEQGLVQLDKSLTNYIPEFRAGGKERITVRHLLTHTSGLRPGIETRSEWAGQKAAVAKAVEESVQNEPGTTFRYSDINFILLGELVQRVSNLPLQEFVARKFYRPLKMVDTGFLPPQEKQNRIAPTEIIEGVPLRGIVHDPTARKMGGVAGHAGLFTTAPDLARFARMLLNKGTLDGIQVMKPETVALMTSVQTKALAGVRRGLGWDIDSPYSGPRGRIFPIGSYGHTGWTGTSIWIDPFSNTFVILLSNRNHPTERGSVIPLRAQVGTLAAEAVPDFNFAFVPGALPAITNTSRSSPPAPSSAQVLNGIDVLAKKNFLPLRNLRIGLITNHTGHDQDRNPTIDLLKNAEGVQLVALFSPEHGIRGVLDENVGDTIDHKTGLPIFSLYGQTRKPTGEHLANLDALVFDIQDIGCRFYTYISTMGLAMEAAAEHGKQFIVLDRVNPITGIRIDGPVLTDKTSFVGFHKIPLQHGMTVGELAKMFRVERDCKVDLTVIAVENWERKQWFDETGLPWTNPSPNMRNLKQAALYPGIGLLESALSVGRGTDTPFEVVGAPYIDDVKFANELNRAGLPGLRFVPIRFTPNASIHKNQECGGVYIFLTDREQCRVVEAGLAIATTLEKLYPEAFDLQKIRHLLLHPETLEALIKAVPLADIRSSWQKDLNDFENRRAKYLIYK